MKLGKKALVGEGILNIYRIFLVILIAFVVLGTAAIFYSYYLDVRNVEAEILSKQIIDCLNSKIINIDSFDYAKYQYKFLDYCGIRNTERFYVSLIFSDTKEYAQGNLKFIKKFEQGDSGIEWVRDILKNSQGHEFDNLEKYKPGYFERDYPVNIIVSGKKINANVLVEVVIAHEL